MVKVKLKKVVEVPAPVQAVIDRVTKVPVLEVAKELEGFTWTFDKGDFYQWVALFNHFDTFFEEHVKSRSDLTLKYGEPAPPEPPPFPLEPCLAILRTSAIILENCSNKQVYQSYEHLALLLASPHHEVVLGALQVLVAFLKKTHMSSMRWAGCPALTERILALARGWGGREEGLDLVSCATEGAELDKQVVQRVTTLHYQWFQEELQKAEASGAGSKVEAGGPAVIHIPALDKVVDREDHVVKELIQRYNVPETRRYELLSRVRLAMNFSSLSGRRFLIQQRLLSFFVMCQSNVSQDEINTFFSNEPEFVTELVALIQAEEGVPELLRTQALRALAVQLLERARHASVVSAITVGGQNGLLSTLLHKSISSLVGRGDAAKGGAEGSGKEKELAGTGEGTSTRKGGGPEYSTSFVEALLSLVGALVTSTTGSTALGDAGMVCALLPLLRDMTPEHIGLVSSTVKILEAYLDFSQTATTTFRDLGGLSEMINRLAAEVGIGHSLHNSEKVESTTGTAEAPRSAGASTSRGSVTVDPPSLPTSETSPSTSKPQVPYSKRLLLRFLLRAIALASYAPSSGSAGTRPSDQEATKLYQCLRQMYLRADEFGGSLFALAASVMTDLIHHDPLCFRTLDDAGLPEAFLTTITTGLLPATEAVCCIPNTLGALCLNSAGLKRVREMRALDVFVPIFTSKKYLKAIYGDTSSILGAGLEELFRFVPALRAEGVEVIITIFKVLCILGGDKEEIADAEKQVAEAAAPTVEPSATEEQPGNAPGAGASEGEVHQETVPMDMDTSSGQPAVVAEVTLDAAAIEVGTVEQHAEPQEASGDVEMAPVDADAQAQGEAEAEAGEDAAAAGAREAALKLAGTKAIANILQGALQQPHTGDTDAYLPHMVSYASRMVESLLSNPETSKCFVEKGGTELMLKLHSLPRMPPSFSFSTVSTPLMAAFRILAPSHGLSLSVKTKDALVKVLGQALEKAREVGNVSVPMLQEPKRTEYMRTLLWAMGVISLGSAVARNASPMLLQVCANQPPVIAMLGQLERLLYSQLVVAEEWKLKKELEEKKGTEQAGEAEPAVAATTSAPETPSVLPDGQDAMEDGELAEPGASEENETGIPMDTAPGEGEVTAPSGPPSEAKGTKKKRSADELSYDALVQCIAAIRNFYTAVAKSVHTPARRREDPTAQPNTAMKAAAANLAVVLKGNLQLEIPTSDAGDSEAGPSLAVRKRTEHLLRLTEELTAVLFDSRRRSCHLLVLNYFMTINGGEVLKCRFQDAVELMFSAAAIQEEAKESKALGEGSTGGTLTRDASMSDANPLQGLPYAFLGGSGAGEKHSSSSGTGKDLKSRAEKCLLSFLSLYDQLSNAILVFSSAQASTLLVASLPPVPGHMTKAAFQDAPAFLGELHTHIMSSVLPLWTHPQLHSCSNTVLNALLSVLNHCVEGSSGALMFLRYGPRGGSRLAGAPDPAQVQHIVEMGFSQQRAEEALRRVGHNSVELAMEWLLSHPEIPGAAAAPGPGQAEAVNDDDVMASGLASAFDVIGPSPVLVPISDGEVGGSTVTGGASQVVVEATVDSSGATDVASTSADQPQQEPEQSAVPGPVQLVDGAVNLLVKAPGVNFAVVDLLHTMCSKDSGRNRNAIIKQLTTRLTGVAPGEQRGLTRSQAEAAVSRNPLELLIPARLLLQLFTKDIQACEVAYSEGLVKAILELLEVFVADYQKGIQGFQSRGGKSAEEATPSAKEVYQIPVWVEAVLLILECMSNASIKQSNGTGASRNPGPGAPANNRAPGPRAAEEALAGLSQVPGDSVMGEAVEGGVPPVTPEGTDMAVGAGVMPDVGAGGASLEQAEPRTPTANTGGPVGGPSTSNALLNTLAPELVGLQGLHEALKTWSPCGVINEEEQERALKLLMQLLRYLHDHAQEWAVLVGSALEADCTNPNPVYSTQAVLQLMACLTRRHANAQYIMSQGAHHLLLSLPVACLSVNFLRLEPSISTILRHMLEDPVTLEAWMESEIRNCLTSRRRTRDIFERRDPFRSPENRLTSVSTFLSMLRRVIHRDPYVFLQAVSRCCALEGGGMGDERLISLKKPKEETAKAPQTGDASAPAEGLPKTALGSKGQAAEASMESSRPTQQGTSSQPGELTPVAKSKIKPATPVAPASTRQNKGLKSNRKVIPPSFVEVVDCLMDALMSFKGHPLVPTNAGSQETIKSDMEVDAGSAPETKESNTEGQGAVGPANSGTTEAANKLVAIKEEVMQQLSRLPHESMIQVLVLKMLTEYCLLFGSTVTLVLKRDTEGGSGAHHRELLKSASKASRDGGKSGPGGSTETPKAGAFLRHIMHVQLVAEDNPQIPGLSENASHLLQAICIRSAEGRRRIVAEIVQTLMTGVDGGDPDPLRLSLPGTGSTIGVRSSNAFVHKEGRPPPEKLRAFVTLVGSLVHTAPSQNANQDLNPRHGPTPQASISVEVIKTLREQKAVKALAQCLSMVKLDHPAAAKTISRIVQPLEILTRNVPGWGSRAMGALQGGDNGRSGRGGGGGGGGQSQQAPGSSLEAQASGQREGAETGPEHEDRQEEAGPAALAAAERFFSNGGRAAEHDMMAALGGLDSLRDADVRFLERHLLDAMEDQEGDEDEVEEDEEGLHGDDHMDEDVPDEDENDDLSGSSEDEDEEGHGPGPGPGDMYMLVPTAGGGMELMARVQVHPGGEDDDSEDDEREDDDDDDPEDEEDEGGPHDVIPGHDGDEHYDEEEDEVLDDHEEEEPSADVDDDDDGGDEMAGGEDEMTNGHDLEEDDGEEEGEEEDDEDVIEVEDASEEFGEGLDMWDDEEDLAERALGRSWIPRRGVLPMEILAPVRMADGLLDDVPDPIASMEEVHNIFQTGANGLFGGMGGGGRGRHFRYRIMAPGVLSASMDLGQGGRGRLQGISPQVVQHMMSHMYGTRHRLLVRPQPGAAGGAPGSTGQNVRSRFLDHFQMVDNGTNFGDTLENALANLADARSLFRLMGTNPAAEDAYQDLVQSMNNFRLLANQLPGLLDQLNVEMVEPGAPHPLMANQRMGDRVDGRHGAAAIDEPQLDLRVLENQLVNLLRENSSQGARATGPAQARTNGPTAPGAEPTAPLPEAPGAAGTSMEAPGAGIRAEDTPVSPPPRQEPQPQVPPPVSAADTIEPPRVSMPEVSGSLFSDILSGMVMGRPSPSGMPLQADLQEQIAGMLRVACYGPTSAPLPASSAPEIAAPVEAPMQEETAPAPASTPPGPMGEGPSSQDLATSTPMSTDQPDAEGELAETPGTSEPMEAQVPTATDAAAAAPANLDLQQAAAAAGIDLAFLEALPPELRAEVLGVTPTPAATQPPQATQEAPQEVALAEGPVAAAGGEAAAGDQAAAGDDDTEGIDPEFLAALPPEIREELLEQQRQERARSRREREAAAQQQQAVGGGGGPTEMDMASLLATFPPDIREDVLLSADETMLATLPPNLLAEAQVLRERHMRHMREIPGPPVPPRRYSPAANPSLYFRGSLGAGGGMPGRLLRERAMRGLPHPGASKAPLEIPETPAMLETEELQLLVKLLQVPSLAKSQLNKLFLNICTHGATRQQILQMLLAVLTVSKCGEKLESFSSMSMVDEKEEQPAALADLLDKAPREDSGAHPAGGSPQTHATTARRVLDVVSHLSRQSQQVSKALLNLRVPPQQSTVQDVRGKRKMMPTEAPSEKNPRALEVLLGFLSEPLCQRSVSTLEQTLFLIELLLQTAVRSIEDERLKKEEERRRAEEEAKKKEEEAKKEEEEAKKRKEEAKKGEEEAKEEKEVPKAEESAAKEKEDPEGNQGNVSAEAAGGSVVGMEVGEKVEAEHQVAGTAQPSQAFASEDTRKDSVKAGPSKSPDEQQLVELLEGLSDALLKQLPGLLARENLSDTAYTRAGHIITLIVQGAPKHMPLMLAELCSHICTLSGSISHSIQEAVALGVDTSTNVITNVATQGSMLLRMMHALQSFNKGKKEGESNGSLSTSGAAASAPTGAAVPPAPDANQAGTSTKGSTAPNTAEGQMREQLLTAVSQIASQTEKLWKTLSQFISSLEDQLKAMVSSQRGESGAAARILPPGAMQVLPLVESFVVLCTLQDAIPPVMPEAKDLFSAASAELSQLLSQPSNSGRIPPSPLASSSSLVSQPSSSLSQSATEEKHLPFLNFAERHRRLLNAYLRRNPNLLESSLGPLLRTPKLIDFDNKRSYFKSKVRSADDRMYGSLRITVRREHVFEDSFHQLKHRTPEEMRSKLSVQFQGEEGIDAGGVSREWFQVMAREMFNPNLALFVNVPEGGTTFQPNANSIVQSDRSINHLDLFRFVGRVVGKALYDGQLIDAYFTRSFYKHMLGLPLTYEDIEAVDPEYYKNLKWMLENDITDVLDLNFTAETDFFGKQEIVELVPGGKDMKVTEQTKHHYVNLMARHRMTTSINAQLQAFLEGFWQLIPRRLISIFNDHELELLISGLPDIDVADLRANTEYQNYTAASPVIQWFWEVVQGLDKEDLALLLQFVTGTSKVPLDGFKSLQGISGPQKFQIQKAFGPKDRLPSAHTCFNQLDLPDYDSKEQLAERLMLAVHEGSEGFGFG